MCVVSSPDIDDTLAKSVCWKRDRKRKKNLCKKAGKAAGENSLVENLGGALKAPKQKTESCVWDEECKNNQEEHQRLLYCAAVVV